MGNIPKGWRTKEWKEFKQQNPNDYLDKLHGREKPFGFNKANLEQLEFDFGLMETIDRSLNMQ
jgi:hypothetical protein